MKLDPSPLVTHPADDTGNELMDQSDNRLHGTHHYTWDQFLAEFYPDPADKATIAVGVEQLRAEQRAFRLAEIRRRLGITQA